MEDTSGIYVLGHSSPHPIARPCSESAVPSSAGRGAVSADPPTRRQARPGAASRPPRPTSQTGVGVPPPAAPPPGRHPPTAPGATCRCRDSRTTAASPGRVRRAGVPCTPASSALATQGGCASHAWVRPRRRSLALSPPPAVVGLKMSELRVDGHKAGAAKTGTGTALGNISVNSPDSKKLYTQKGGGSTIFRSWRESGSSNHSNQGERRSSGGRPVGVTLDVSASFDAGLGARGGKASADSQGAGDAALRRSTGSLPQTAGAPSEGKAKWWSQLRPEDSFSPRGLHAPHQLPDLGPADAAAIDGGRSVGLVSLASVKGSRADASGAGAAPDEPASPRRVALPAPGSPLSRVHAVSATPPLSPHSPRTPPRGVTSLVPPHFHGDAQPLLLASCSSPVKPGTIPDDLWDESDQVVASFFALSFSSSGASSPSTRTESASEQCLRLLIEGRFMGTDRAAEPGTAAEVRPGSAQAATTTTSAGPATAAALQAQRPRSSHGGYASAYQSLKERGAAGTPAAAPPAAARHPQRTVLVAGLAFSLREDFLTRPPVASMTVPEIQAEKHELKVELKGVDKEFIQQMGRKATKAEKESLRAWYVRYWRLKHALTKADPGGARRSEEEDEDM